MYTVPDDIKCGHGDTWYNTYDDFVNDEPACSRDKDDPDSINRFWSGNGHVNFFEEYKIKYLILYRAFEGFTSYDKYLTIAEIESSLEQILQLAKDIFPNVEGYKDVYKIEIINIANNEVLGVINI